MRGVVDKRSAVSVVHQDERIMSGCGCAGVGGWPDGKRNEQMNVVVGCSGRGSLLVDTWPSTPDHYQPGNSIQALALTHRKTVVYNA